MARTKKTRALIGRPPETEEAKQTKDDERLAVAERLAMAFANLRWTQGDAARHTDLRPGWISDLINARRSITVSELRAFAKAGISADYLLGFSKANTPPNATLVAGLAREMARRLTDDLPPGEKHYWVVDGAKALDTCVAALRPHADAHLALGPKLEAVVARYQQVKAQLEALPEDKQSRIANLAIEELWPDPPPQGPVSLHSIERRVP